MKHTPFIKWLNSQLAAVTKFATIEEKPTTGEEVVGVMNVELRRLYTVLDDYAEYFSQLIGDSTAGCTHENPPSQEVLAKLKKAEARLILLKEIFWHEVEEVFGLDDDNLTICSDYQIVKPVPCGDHKGFGVTITIGNLPPGMLGR